MLDFPASPTLNQIFTAPNGSTWRWDGIKWATTSAGTAFLPLAGGTMTGPLIQAADPVQPLGSATKQYVDATNIRYRNRVINGDMSVDIRNGGALVAAPAANTYIIDRWKLNANIASRGNVGQGPMGAVAQPATGGFQYCLTWQTTTAYTPAAADILNWIHFVEGCNFNDAMWGTANAQPVVIEFWAQASIAGTYAVALRNNTNARSYVATFTLPGTWTKVRLNIPGDTAGTWAVANNAFAITLTFNLGDGSNFVTTPNAWQAGNFYTAAGVVNPVATLNAYLYITGVALMVGAAASNAEPEFRKYSDNLIDCQRYFNRAQVAFNGYSTPGSAYASGYFGTNLRASATFTLLTNNSSNFTISSYANLLGFNGVTVVGNVTATGNYGINLNVAADADF
jgi:hypothetical protein